MHLNPSNGSAAYGFAAVAVDGSTPAALSGVDAGNPNGPGWLTASKLAYQNFDSTAFVQSYDVGTTALATLDSTGANMVCAGGGIWAAWLVGGTVRSNAPGVTGQALGDVSNDGEVVTIGAYPSLVGLTVYSAAGATLLSLPSVTVQPMSGTAILRCRNHLLVYVDASLGWRMANVIGGPFSYAPRINETINWTVPVTISSGTTYVLEASDRLTLRQANQAKGWQLYPLGTLTFNPDVIEVSAGVLRIGSCLNSGESPDSLVLLDLTLATGATRNGVVDAGAIVWSDGPTLSLTTFQIGPVQGSAAQGDLYPPVSHPVVDPKTGLITRAWEQYELDVKGGVAASTAFIQANPSMPASAGFGIIGGVTATMANDALALTSADNSVTITANPATKTVDFSVPSGGGGVPFLIAAGETFTVPAHIQALFAIPIDNEGTLIVDGYLIQVT